MHPELVRVGSFALPSYGVALVAAFVVAIGLLRRRAPAFGVAPDAAADVAIWLLLSGLAGAKLLLLVVEGPRYLSSWDGFVEFLRSGGVFYGGLILAVAVAFWYIHRHRLPLWTTCDVFAPGIALGHVTGRLGCMAAGCCYGRPTDVPWAVIFTNPLAAANVGTPLGIPLHPTQLYEAGAELLILVVLLVFERRGRVFGGRTFWAYMLLYAVSRFVIEFYRGDPRGMVFGVLSTSQFISLLLAPLALGMLVYLSRVTPTMPEQARRRRVAA